MRKLQQILIGTIAVAMMLSGCVAYNSLPVAARAGDTITVAIGSADGATTSNTTATYFPDTGGSVPLTVKSVFNLYADRKSQAVTNPGNSYWDLLETSGHEPWITLMAVDLPTTGLTVGAGFLMVDTPATYPTTALHVNQIPIELEILPGTGTPHPLSYQIGANPVTAVGGDLRDIEAVHHVTVKPNYDRSFVYPTYAAIELTLKFAVDGTPPSEYQLISDDVSLYTGSGRNIIQKVLGDELTVIYISPNGLLTYFEPRFSIVPLPAKALSRTAPSTMPTVAPTVSDVKYYDIDGNLIAGPPTSDYAIVME